MKSRIKRTLVHLQNVLRNNLEYARKLPNRALPRHGARAGSADPMCLVKGPDEIHRLPLLSIPDTKVLLVVVECQQQWTPGETGSVLTRRPPNVQRAVRQLPRSPDGNHERGHRRYGGPYGNEHPGDRAEAMREGLKDGRITRSRPPFREPAEGRSEAGFAVAVGHSFT